MPCHCCEEPETRLDHTDSPVCDDCFQSRSITCDDCRSIAPNESPSVNPDGNPVCESCAESYATCERCDTVVNFDDCHTVNDRRWSILCEECYDRFFCSCDDCGEEISRSLEYTNSNDQPICEGCLDNYFQCGDCHYITPVEQSNSTPGNDVCDDCYSNYGVCSGCDESFHQDNLINGRCSDCGVEREIVNFQASDEFERLGSARCFGIELETSAGDPTDVSNSFAHKVDGSIAGWEFVSPVLSSDAAIDEIELVCRQFASFEVNETCGFHLHIGAGDLNQQQLSNVCRAYRETESIWQSFVPQARRTNRFCRPLDWLFVDRPFLEFVESRDSRYYWLNVQAYIRHRTLEIRLHPGTLDPIAITNWVKAHLRFFDAAISIDDDRFAGEDAFLAISDIWADPVLTEYYRQVAEQHGTNHLIPEQV